MIDYRKIDWNKLKLEYCDKDSKFVNVRYNDSELTFFSPSMKLPFGLEKEYNNYYFKLEFTTKKNNTDIINFKLFIEKLEKTFNEFLEEDIPSQIKYNNKYDPLLICKIPNRFNKLQCIIKEKSENINIYNIEKGSYIKCLLFIDKIWKYNNNFYYKIKVKSGNII